MEWHRTQNQSYLDLLIARLSKDRLTWVDQIHSLILSHFPASANIQLRINEIGCNVGHFYRLVAECGFAVDYVGYDIDNTYLSIASSVFPYGEFKHLDIQKAYPRLADITVVSATLEHVDSFAVALENILTTTTKMVLLRTFIGDEPLADWCQTVDAHEPYLIRQFTLPLILQHCVDSWDLKIERDLATDSLPRFVCNNSTIKRTQQILILTKKELSS